MRLPTLLLSAAAALAAAGAVAQNPPAAPPAKAEAPASGLSDLSETVETLQDEPVPAPAEPSPEAASLDDRGVHVQPPDAGTAVPVGPDGQPLPPAAESGPPATEPVPPPAEAPAPTATSAPPAAPTLPAEPLTRAQLDELAAATQRGRLLAAIAAAGQIATRDMLSRVSDPAGAGIAGWIAEPAGNGATVTFYAEGEGDAPPGAVYRVSIIGGRVTERGTFLAGNRPPLNGVQARMAAARRAAAAQEHRPCGGDQFNYFVIPPDGADAPIDVYQISPQTARGRFPVGGHFKTTIAADGSIAASRGYTDACLDIDVPEVAPGTRPTPLGITHLQDPLPTEIHAFLSIWTGRPLVVGAGEPLRLFGVTGEGMGELRESPR